MPVEINQEKDANQLTVSPEIEALFKAGAHIGYSKAKRHPKMGEYIFCTRNDVEIFNLQKTDEKIADAEKYLKELGKTGKVVLWVGTKPAAKIYIKEAGEFLGAPYIAGRWLGGTLTNFKNIEERLTYLNKLEKEAETGELDRYVKKEKLQKLTELQKMKKMFEGLRSLKGMPQALVIVDPKAEKTATAEALKKKIDIIAILNNNNDPDKIKYPVPANDNSSGAIGLITKRLADAYAAGVKEKQSQTS